MTLIPMRASLVTAPALTLIACASSLDPSGGTPSVPGGGKADDSRPSACSYDSSPFGTGVSDALRKTIAEPLYELTAANAGETAYEEPRLRR